MLAAGGPPIQMSANPPSGAAKDDDVDGCDHPPRPSIFVLAPAFGGASRKKDSRFSEQRCINAELRGQSSNTALAETLAYTPVPGNSALVRKLQAISNNLNFNTGC